MEPTHTPLESSARGLPCYRATGLRILVRFVVVIALTLPMASARTGLGASDPESEARELFVEAAKIAHSGPCAGESTASLFVSAPYFNVMASAIYQILSKAMDISKLKSSLDCLEHLKIAIHLQQRVLSEFPQTEVAFYLATNGYVTVEDIDRLIAQTRQQISERSELPSDYEKDPFATLLGSVNAAAETDSESPPLPLAVLDSIRRQVEDNWSLPAGATDAADLAVEIEIVLLPDGTVRSARIVDSARLNQAGEEFFRSMAESAIRAVRRASPLRNLPPEKYELWREITFSFRPSL